MSKKKIKIAFIIDFFLSRKKIMGGTERQLIELVKHLDRERFDPLIIYLNEFHTLPELNDLGCEVKCLDIYSFKSPIFPIKILKFVYFLRKKRVNILQMYFFDSTIIGTIAGKLAGVKKIVTTRRDMGFWYDKNKVKILRFINKFTTKILVNSKAIKLNTIKIEKVKQEKIKVIYNGVDLRNFNNFNNKTKMQSLENMKKNKNIGIVANFNRKVKRLDLFLQAAAIVSQKINDVNFLIVGGGALETELKTLATKLGINSKTYFMGNVENPIPIIRTFDVAVLSSDSEGFSNTLLEYMGCGVPIVATAVGGNKELIKNGINGILVAPNNPDELAEKIIYLIQRDDVSNFLKINAKKVLHNNFKWEKIITHYQNFYENLDKL